MRTLIFVVIVGIGFSCFASDSEAQVTKCVRTDRLVFTEIYPRIRFSTDPEKKEFIDISYEVDCASGAIIIPESTADAIERLDSALPADYKIAISKGASMTSFRYGDFAASADLDLLRYFTRLWGLEWGAPACTEVDQFREKDFQCYFSLIQIIRRSYHEMISYVPPDIGEED